MSPSTKSPRLPTMSHHAVRLTGRLRRTPITAAPKARTPRALKTTDRATWLGLARFTNAISTPPPRKQGSNHPGRAARGASECPAPLDAGARSLAAVLVMHRRRYVRTLRESIATESGAIGDTDASDAPRADGVPPQRPSSSAGASVESADGASFGQRADYGRSPRAAVRGGARRPRRPRVRR